jgi:3-methyladenine DNA glycosylase AlkD
MTVADEIIDALRTLGSEDKAKHLSRFFKTGKGEYGEGDKMLGVKVPETRTIVKEYKDIPLEQIQTLLDSEWHEVRLCALLILVKRMKSSRTTDKEREDIYEFYLKNTRRCNNWDLVDMSCRDILGEYIYDKDRSVLYELAESDSLWEQRIAIVSTWAFIKRGDFEFTFRLAVRYINHPHDLIQKATGWMLREVGKVDKESLTEFLEEYADQLPRTTLRYAIERYPESERSYFMSLKRIKRT